MESSLKDVLTSRFKEEMVAFLRDNPEYFETAVMQAHRFQQQPA